MPGISWIAEDLSTLQRGNLLHGIQGDIPVFFRSVLNMHLSYREAYLSIPCWYQSVFSIINRRVATFHRPRSFLNWWQPRFSSWLETDYKCSVKISLATTVSEIIQIFVWRVNLFSDRLLSVMVIFSASLFLGNICKKVSPLTFNRH